MTNYFNNKNILITGGLGFLGSNLAHRLHDYGANITIIDNLYPLYGGNLFNLEGIYNDIEVIISDIQNLEIITPLIEKADIIYHFAAQVSYIDSLSIPYHDLNINARATLSILESCRKNNSKPKIIFSSSRMVYGFVEAPIVTEKCSTNPLSLYGIHKLTSEKYLSMYYKDFGIPTVILRITNPYGPRQQLKHNKYSLVGWFIRQAMEGKTINIFGDGNQLRDYIFVDDIIDAMIKCGVEKKAIGNIINLGSGISTKFRDMVSDVISCVNNGNIQYTPWPKDYEKIETGDFNVDISKLQNITGWEPKFSLKEGIKKTFEYYLINSKKYF